MSYYIIRKFVKGTKIVSFEPNLYNFLKLKEIKKKISFIMFITLH